MMKIMMRITMLTVMVMMIMMAMNMVVCKYVRLWRGGVEGR